MHYAMHYEELIKRRLPGVGEGLYGLLSKREFTVAEHYAAGQSLSDASLDQRAQGDLPSGRERLRLPREFVREIDGRLHDMAPCLIDYGCPYCRPGRGSGNAERYEALAAPG